MSLNLLQYNNFKKGSLFDSRWHSQRRRSHKFIPARPSYSVAVMNGIIRTENDHNEEFHDYINSCASPETMVPSFYRKFYNLRSENYHRCVSITNQNQTPPWDTGSSSIRSISRRDTPSTMKNDLRQVCGRYVDENHIPHSVELPPLYEDLRSYSMNDLV